MFFDILSTLSFYLEKLSPIIYILIGALIGYGVDWFRKYREFCQTREYFFHSLYTLKGGIIEQIRNYELYIKEIQAKENYFPTLRIDTVFNLDSIDIVSKVDLFNIFIKKRDKKDSEFVYNLYNLLNAFQIIRGVLTNYKIDDDSIHNDNIRILSKFDNTFAKLRDFLVGIDSNYDRGRYSEPYLELFDKINKLTDEFNKKISEKNITIHQYIQDLIIPLKKLVFEATVIYHRDTVIDLEQIYFEFLDSRKRYVDKIKKDIELLKSAKKYITNLLQKNKKYIDKTIVELDVIFINK